MGALLTWLARASVILVVCQTAAVAQPQTPTPDDLKRAKTLARTGNEYYDAGKYLQAIVAYREAYALSRASGFLYNIAQAFRLGGDCVEAFNHYERYLKESSATSRRKQVERHLAELRECAGKTDEPPAPVDTSVNTDVQTDAAPGPEPPTAQPDVTQLQDPGSPGRGMRWAGLATATIGVAALATGGYFGLRARSLSDEVSASGDEPTTWNQDLAEKESQGKSAQTNAIVLLSVGSAAVIAGTTLYLLGMRDGRGGRTSTAWIAPTSHGASIGWSWQF